MKRLLIILFTVIAMKMQAQLPEVNIPGSEVRKITSQILAGQEYKLQVMLPAGYNNSNKKYPVLYLMDSQWDFPLVTALYGEQYYDGFIPSMIIVGITWGGNNPNPDSLRARDYTPTNEMRLPQSGGAEKFLSFIQKEVFPFVEVNYRADKNDRTLMGCSLGGLFTLYTLFTKPGLFQNYVAASPTFSWGNEIIYQYEKKYSEQNQQLPAKLFMCVGGVERGVPGFEKLTKYLAARNYKNLQVQSMVLENTGHSGTKGEGYARGLQYVFAKPLIHPPATELKKYIGQFQLSDGTKVGLKMESNELALYFSPTNKYILQAAGDDFFYAKAEFLNVHFINTQGTITDFQLERYGNTQLAEKIK